MQRPTESCRRRHGHTKKRHRTPVPGQRKEVGDGEKEVPPQQQSICDGIFHFICWEFITQRRKETNCTTTLWRIVRHSVGRSISFVKSMPVVVQYTEQMKIINPVMMMMISVIMMFMWRGGGGRYETVQFCAVQC